MKGYRCFLCNKKYPAKELVFECGNCGGPLDVEYDFSKVNKNKLIKEYSKKYINHWKYKIFYPSVKNIVSLGEGGTPLIKDGNYMFKFEGVNPTGSFKDRGSTVEISVAKDLNVKKVICASTGNMGSSVAAYSSYGGIKSTIFVPSFASKIKIAQIKSYGSEAKIFNKSYEYCEELTKKLWRKKHIYLTGDYPFRGEGEKSVGFEIIDQLGFKIPDYIVMPIGNATLLSGVFKGLKEFKKVGLIKKLPKLVGVQVKGCNPIVEAYRKGKDTFKPIKDPKTIATAICCGNPIDGEKALKGIYETKGKAIDVSDKELLDARRKLGRKGIYSETSGAVSYAGALKLKLKGKVVVVVTGHGLKELF